MLSLSLYSEGLAELQKLCYSDTFFNITQTYYLVCTQVIIAHIVSATDT